MICCAKSRFARGHFVVVVADYCCCYCLCYSRDMSFVPDDAAAAVVVDGVCEGVVAVVVVDDVADGGGDEFAAAAVVGCSRAVWPPRQPPGHFGPAGAGAGA